MIGTGLIGSLVGGWSLYNKIYYTAYVNGQIDLLVQQEFNKKYGATYPMSDPAASRELEMRSAFINGKIVREPYYANRNELEKLVQEGKKLREELKEKYGK